MPVLRVDDECPVVTRPTHLAVHHPDHVRRAVDEQRALRVGEVVLHVDDDQRRRRAVALRHGARVARPLRNRLASRDLAKFG
jgi:hypothetical protein